MSVKNWSDTILLGELQGDPAFSDDLSAITEQVEANSGLDVVLNFADVNYLNSSNIAKLLRLRKMLVSKGRNLKLTGVNNHVWGLFLVTGLEKIFSFCDDVSAGLASVQLERK